jgi:serine/threonine protein kinase
VNPHSDVRELFQSALQRPAHERAQWLERNCSGNPSLLNEIKTLLAAHEQAPGFLDQPLLHLRRLADPGITDELDEEPLSGTIVGAYRLIRPIGSGGMGVVWLGERADGLYECQVAIKFIRCLGPMAWMDRFRTEQRALAALDHPFIARLLDAGNSDSGLPYFVMEHVDGTRIDGFCAQRQLTTHDRLQLFRKVCEAVEYAHRRLIIHRDIKPSNILVNSLGIPKLLDFGIAKLLNQPPSALDDLTWTLGRFFTPEYASPEQILGEPVTTATDVFSLGAVLYELLTGQKRFLWSKDSPTPLRDLIHQKSIGTLGFRS